MAAPSRSTSRRTTAPKAKVTLDLDKLDQDSQEPFTTRLKGKVFTFASPSDMPYFDLTDLPADRDGERQFLAKLLGDQLDAFMECEPSVSQVMSLFDAWRDYNELPDPGEAGASVTSSNGTARR